MLIEEGEMLGHPSISVQNRVLRFSILRDTGEIAELSSLRTGHDQLMADGDAVEAGAPRWGTRDDSVPSGGCHCTVEQVDDCATIAAVKRHDGCLYTRVYTFEEDSARVRVASTIENQAQDRTLVRERLAYNLMVGGEVENSGVLSHFVQRNSVTVPHYGHRFFVGKRPEYSTDRFFEDYEAFEQGFQPSTFRSSEHGDPTWVAVVDTTIPEGFGVRFLSPTGGVELHHQYFHFPFSIYLVQTGPWTWLKPGDLTVYRYEMIIFDGLPRVDYIGDGFLVGVDLERAITRDERQEITVSVLALEPCAGRLGIELHSDRPEVDDVIEWDLGLMERRTWSCSAGPFQGIERLKKLWYYFGKMAGEVGRPVPQVVVCDGASRFERKFVVSLEVEEIMKGLSDTLDEARREPNHSLELVGALRACVDAARRIKRQEGDVEQLYRLWERAICILQGFRTRGDWRVFTAKEPVSVASNEHTRPLVERLIENVAQDLSIDATMGYPGRRSYRGLQLADLAAQCSFCYAVTGEERFGRKAVEILRSFAADNALYGVTGAGNPLHISMQIKGLLQAYDWVYDRLTEDDHTAVMVHFLWLYDYTEQHANVTGHNDEIQEGGATACLAARFGYLDGSVRKLKRGVAILRKHLDFVDEDGGWPECPNYNALIARSYFDYAEILYRSGINLYEETDGRSIGDMARWLKRVLTPYHDIPQFGDSVRRYISPDTFLYAAGRYRDGEMLRIWHDMTAATGRTPDPVALMGYPCDTEPCGIEGPLSEVLRATGYALLRSGFDPDSQYLALDYGPQRIGHSHLDRLTFEIHAAGVPLVVDTGYGLNDTKYHNCVLVDSSNQPSWLEGKLNWFSHEPTVDRLSVSLDVADGVTWERRVIYERGKFFVIYDLLRSDHQHTYTWFLNLDGTLTRGSTGFDLASPGGAGLVAVPLGGYDAEAGTTQHADYDAKSLALTRREIPQLRIETEGKSLVFGALLVPYVGVAPEVEVQGEMHISGMNLTVTLDGVSRRVCEG